MPLNEAQRRRLAIFNVHIFCRLVLSIINVKVLRTAKSLSDRSSPATLVVANHQSYLDVVIIGAMAPTVFVTSIEIRDTFFLGFLCKLAGCEFIERRKIWNLKHEINTLRELLECGFHVAIFPEGTTTNGANIEKFKSSLLETAVLAKARTMPICINYLIIDDCRVSKHNRDTINWYGDMTFADHFYKLVTRKTIVARIDVLACIESAPSRKIVTYKAFTDIKSKFLPVV